MKIAFPESFHLRKPVLDQMNTEDWKFVESEQRIVLDRELGTYSRSEQAIFKFCVNPYETAENIFGLLDKDNRRALAKAIYELFGPGGFYDKKP